MRTMVHRTPIVAAVAASVLLTGCGAADDPAAARASASGALTTVTVGVVPILDVAPIYLGIKQGFFRRQGLELKIRPAQGGAAIIPGVVRGEYQFGFSNTASLIVSSTNGVPVKVVSAGDASTGIEGADFGAVVTRRDSPIKTAKDLAGKRIAVNTLKNINTVTTNEAVRKDGGDPSRITYVAMPFPEIPAAVAKGVVDAGQVVEPYLTISQGAGLREVTSNFAATDSQLDVGLYFTSVQYAAEHPEMVQKFRTAMAESLDYASRNPEQARKILSTYLTIDPALQRGVLLPRWPIQFSEDSIRGLATLVAKDGLVTTKPNIDEMLS